MANKRIQRSASTAVSKPNKNKNKRASQTSLSGESPAKKPKVCVYILITNRFLKNQTWHTFFTLSR